MSGVRRFKIDSPRVVYESFENEVVIIHFESGNYYSLEKAGADIWNFIDKGAPADEIVKAMALRYEAPLDEIEDAVSNLMTELQEEGLIIPAEIEEIRDVQEQEVSPETSPETERLSFESPMLQRYTDMREMLLLDPIHEVDEAGWPTAKPDGEDEDEQTR